MPRVWVSIGSNINRDEHIRGSIAELRNHFGEVILSPVYESDAVGFEGEAFYNLVIGFDTNEEPGSLAGIFRAIEETHGRQRGGEKFSSRTLDVDLLTYGDQVVDTPALSLPRDEITRYAFVLRPLADVAVDEVHPLTGKAYGELWAEFDQASQPLWPVEFDFSDT